MRVLVIGSGGREHALAWRLAASPSVERVIAAPGNPGIAIVGDCVASSDPTPAGYLAIAQHVQADLTVVGPEAPLVAGIVDHFRAAGMHIVGPNAAAARLEGSKIYTKYFFQQSGIPTARYVTVDNPQAALAELHHFTYPVVLKADGLAAGKGVIIAHNRAEAEAACATLKGPLLMEEFLEGEEVSFIALCDGKNIVPLAPTQDHKAVYDGDTGPNTGGMGAYSDDRILTSAETQYILDTVMQPTVAAHNFSGFLYAGLMMTAEGPKVLEFNVRLGDPETQPLMHRLHTDLGEVLMAAATGNLANTTLRWEPGASICVVLASGGYPGEYRTGIPIKGLQNTLPSTHVFHAGTRMGASGVETAGGRVLGVTASGPTLRQAIRRAYDTVDNIHFEGMHFRKDIGQKGLKRYN